MMMFIHEFPIFPKTAIKYKSAGLGNELIYRNESFLTPNRGIFIKLADLLERAFGETLSLFFHKQLEIL
jgi:hypothetical protein